MAWRQVSSIGYWVTVSLSNTTDSAGLEQWVAEYTLIYGKKDAIRRVTGRDVLI
ncbi:hypothetical protein GNAINCEL_00051 [Serratia phage KKP 3709]|nr:hypothetical protein GNAINCEL_00051 [Serratia phage KKP 3709]